MMRFKNLCKEFIAKSIISVRMNLEASLPIRGDRLLNSTTEVCVWFI